jgi:hypothetical protein
MAAREAIIGEEWKERSRDLADWAMDHLVNRRNVCGQYALISPEQARESGRTYKATTLPVPEMHGEDRVTLDKMERHVASRRLHRPQLIGLHAESQAVDPWGRGVHALAEQRRGEERIRQWLDLHGLAYTEIALDVGKPIAAPYVDDRGVSCRCRPLDDGPRAVTEALMAVRRLCGPAP